MGRTNNDDEKKKKKKKRKRGGGGAEETRRRSIHPKNKYSHNPPDFSLLASLYPSLEPHVFYSRDGRPRIDWTDYNSTRELTRVLLLHDHQLNWWIPDGQLCPTVPNRSNYIHWLEDLLESDVVLKKTRTDGDVVRGFDIGTGANCIYPLLGASLLGWSFVGSDVTEVAIEWAAKNVESNPHISHLIEIRRVANGPLKNGNNEIGAGGHMADKAHTEPSSSSLMPADASIIYNETPVLLGVVKDGEEFDFCMCNPPFFETIEEAGLNPKTSCGGTPEEMVCPGGENAFITRIIEDSAVLKETFRWYTSMVGRKANLKSLTSKLREIGVTVVKTTEFVQGQTCRWGIAWSFLPPARKFISPQLRDQSTVSFMLEGVIREYSAFHVLQSVESFFSSCGASSTLNNATFSVDISVSDERYNTVSKTEANFADETCCIPSEEPDNNSNHCLLSSKNLCFRVSVFQQSPGTLLVKGSLIQRDNPASGSFASSMQQLEETLRCKFCRPKASNG